MHKVSAILQKFAETMGNLDICLLARGSTARQRRVLRDFNVTVLW
jgi:hypothetical protein